MPDIRSLIRTIEALNEEKRSRNLKSVIWFPEWNTGWYPVIEDGIYDEPYFRNFEGYKSTQVGLKINQFRTDFVLRHTDKLPIDIGAGAGHFIEVYGKGARGTDINPFSVKWLHDHHCYANLDWFTEYDCLTFWDSFEHIAYPWEVLDKVSVGGFVFMTLPLFDRDCVRESKHFKPREHYWLFSETGIAIVMNALGFVLHDSSSRECDFGRDGVRTFAFERMAKYGTQ